MGIFMVKYLGIFMVKYQTIILKKIVPNNFLRSSYYFQFFSPPAARYNIMDPDIWSHFNYEIVK